MTLGPGLIVLTQSLHQQVNECVLVPKEVCSVEQVNPRQVARPIIKKWCTRDPPKIPGSVPTPTGSAPPATVSRRR